MPPDFAETGPCLYVGRVVHRRVAPVRHEFGYRLALLCFDVDRTDAFARTVPWLGVDRRAVVSWWRRDHSGDPEVPLGETVRELVREQTGSRPCGIVRLLTAPRVLGYGFNPISLYFCEDVSGAVEAIVAEVTSTPWQERCTYVLPIPPSQRDREVWRFVTPKRMHVSPFLGMQQDYRWRIRLSADRLSVGIVAAAGAARPFAATMSLVRAPLGRVSGARFLLEPPLGSAGTMAAIHFEALRLWWKGAPYHPHPGQAAGRQDNAEGDEHGDRRCAA